jgi:hypothetical protein
VARKAQTEIAVVAKFMVTCGLQMLSQKGSKAKIILWQKNQAAAGGNGC